MSSVALTNWVETLESGSRPKGGIKDGQGEVPSIGAEHLSDDGGFNFAKERRISFEFYESLKKGRIERNDIIIVKDGATTGKVSFVNGGFPYVHAAINEHVFRLVVDARKADPSFVFRYLQSARGQVEIMRDFRGATVGGIGRTFVDKVFLPDIGLDHQRRIAAILDKADSIRRKREEAIAMADRLLRSTFLAMFGEGGASYEYEPLGPHLSFVTSGSRGWAKYYSKSGARFIRSIDVQMNEISNDEVVLVNPPQSAEVERTRVRNGDVLLTITGSKIGRVTEMVDLPQEAYISQHVAILRTKNTILPGYLSYFLSLPSLGQRQIDKMQYGQSKPGLNLQQIRSFRLPIPALSKQESFIDIVNKVRSQKTYYSLQLAFSADLLGSLTQRAFRGEL